ncbi:hypothetical protein D3C85_812760 [compost metagenome]
MKKTALAFAVGSALILAGCDGTSSPAGAGAGTSETNTSSVSDATAREKALTVAREQGTAQQVQLSALIVTAVQQLRPTWKGQFNDGLDTMACALGLDINRRQEAIEALQPDVGVIIPGMGLDVINQGTQAENNAACMAWMWADATRPVMGWPRTNAPAFSPAANAELRQWAANMLGISLGSSQGLADIAAELAKLPGASTEALAQKARSLLLERANDYRTAYQAKFLELHGKADSVVIDMTNPTAGPHFRLEGYDYQGGPGGGVVTQAGSVLFGEGYLASARYTVEAVASSGQSMTRSSGRTTTSDSTNTNTVNAEARTQ